MDWDSEDIRKQFFGLINDSKKFNSSILEEKYKKFKEDHSKLYEMAINSVMTNTIQNSTRILEMMLNSREDMINGNSNKLAADSYIGNQVAHEFVYPKTGVPKNEDIIRAINELKIKTVNGESLE